MGITENDLCAHVDELIHKEQTALEHLLMDEHRASRLCSNNEKHRQQVGREARPWSVCQSHDRTVDKRLHLVVAVV